MLKPLLLLPTVLLVAYFPALSPQKTSAGQKTASAPAAQPAEKTNEPSARVKEIYKVDCVICHGETGDGKTDLAKDMSLTLSDFSDPRTFAGKSDDQIFEMIRKGKDKMPPEDDSRAKDHEVHGLVTYIRSFSKGQPSPTAAPASAPATAPPAAPATSPTSN